MDKMILFDIDKAFFPDVNKHIVEGRLIVQIKVKSNVKLISANSNILVDVFIDSIDKKYMRKLHNRGGANIYASSGDSLYSMFSINLN
ncbi:hypothetical protein ACFLU5_16950 [Bacteroidota bacterium]